MAKKYYTTIPQQLVPDGLKRTVYKNPGESPILNYGETRFPIVAVIANSVQPGEKIQIYGIRPDFKNTLYWEKELRTELDALAKTNGFSYDIKIIETPQSEVVDNHLDLFQRLTATAEKEDRIYADITFGTKPIPILMLMFMNYAYKYRENTKIESVVYGSFNHESKESSLYDVSALFYMNSTVNRLESASDPAKVIGMLLGLEALEEEI